MRRPLRALLGAATLLALASASPAPAAAQHIALKTVPLPTGEQFLIFPSRSLGMAGLSIALEDPLLDPFRNPALGAAVDGVRVFTSPTFYGDDADLLGGRSLPAGALLGGERFFGGLVLALQQIEDPQRGIAWIPLPEDERRSVFEDNAADNRYALALAGVRLNDGRSSVGASIFHSDLHALDGVNRLYGRSVDIDQSGTITELRLGVRHALDETQRLDATVLRSDVDMVHEVLYVDWVQLVDPAPGQPWVEPRSRVETNYDRTTTWGLRLRYARSLQDGWTVGAAATANRKSHPKIPNYDVVNIPRDPGTSRAFSLGLGLARTLERNTFGVELAWEPARSHTWAYADTALAQPSGGTIEPGGRTVDNRFRFSNFAIASGFEHDRERVAFQLGLGVRSIAYTLDQENYVLERRRLTDESWMEWSPSWGVAFDLSGVRLRYAGRATLKGFPDCWGGCDRVIAVPDAMAPGGNDFLVAVTDPVFFPDYRVTTHQFTVELGF